MIYIIPVPVLVLISVGNVNILLLLQKNYSLPKLLDKPAQICIMVPVELIKDVK